VGGDVIMTPYPHFYIHKFMIHKIWLMADKMENKTKVKHGKKLRNLKSLKIGGDEK
jgi:hypothetical protein